MDGRTKIVECRTLTHDHGGPTHEEGCGTLTHDRGGPTHESKSREKTSKCNCEQGEKRKKKRRKRTGREALVL